MTDSETDKENQDRQNKNAAVKPDSETLNTTDPQEHMKGPISSLMQGIKHDAEKEGESKEEADIKKDEGM